MGGPGTRACRRPERGGGVRVGWESGAPSWGGNFWAERSGEEPCHFSSGAVQWPPVPQDHTCAQGPPPFLPPLGRGAPPPFPAP